MAISQTLTDTEGKVWDLSGVNPIGARFPGQTGQGILNGTSDSYDGGLVLAVGTDLVTSTGTLVNPAVASQSERGREVDTGPVVVAGVAVTRSILVSDAVVSDTGFLRLLDSFTNTTDEPITILAQLISDVGSDSGTVCVEDTSGNNVIETSDHGFVTDEGGNQTGGDSSVGFVYGDGTAQGASAARSSLLPGEGVDEITVQFRLTLQPGETKRLLAFAFQNTTAAQGAADLNLFDDTLPVLAARGVLAGISPLERSQIVNYSDVPVASGVSVIDGSGQEWRISDTTGSLSTVGNQSLLSTQIGVGSPLSSFTVREAVAVSEAGQEVTVVHSSTLPAAGGATISRSLMASPEAGQARFLVTVTAGATQGLDLTGSVFGLNAAMGFASLIGARDLATGGFSTTLDISDGGAVFDDSASGAGGLQPSLAISWGDFSMGEAVDGQDGVKVGLGTLQAVYDDLNLAPGSFASFLYFFATNPDAGMGFGDVAGLATPDFRDLAGLSAAEVAAIRNFDLDEGDRLQTVTGFGTGDDHHAGAYWGELIDGEAGHDVLSGGGSDDVLHGGAGDDTLDGGTGNDVMEGGAEDDTYVVDSTGDRIVELAGGGSDLVRATASVTLGAFVEDLVLEGNAAIDGTGNALANRITGNSAANTLSDGGGTAADLLIGRRGNDSYIVNVAGTKIVEAAKFGRNDSVLAGVSFVLAADDNIETLRTLDGAATTAINLTGNALAQKVLGNKGANRIDGQLGDDTLAGGLGADVFVFSTVLGPDNIDRITDFAAVADTIELHRTVFSGLALGPLAAGRLVQNATGQPGDADDRILYETDTGALFFDRDGTGTAAAVQFATLAAGLTLTGADFMIV